MDKLKSLITTILCCLALAIFISSSCNPPEIDIDPDPEPPREIPPPTFPENFPMTMYMPNNPLFWQFPALTVDAAGYIVPGQVGTFFAADPSARVFVIDGVETLFVYASQDMVQGVGCDRMDRYHVFSTTDMVNWTNYGEIFNASDVPWSRDNYFANNSKFMWAPDAVQGPCGRFFFYFPHPTQNDGIEGSPGNWNNNWRIGVAVSDHPASNFEVLPNYMACIDRSIGRNRIDPHVFIDDCGQAYIFVGGGGRAFGGRLNPDMITLDGPMVEMIGLGDFHEASWVHKYNGRYYFTHSDNGGGGANHGDRMRYAISDNPLGPWTDMGVFINATGNGTIHGSVVEFRGQWYAFYHSDHISNGGEPAGRSVMFAPLFHNPDGTIQLVNTHGTPFRGETRTVQATEGVALVLEAEHFNEVVGVADGGPTFGYHDRNFTVGNHIRRTGLSPILNVYRPVRGMQIEQRAAASNGHNIGDLETKEFMRYTIFVEEAGLYDVDVFVASERSSGRFQLHSNGITRTGEITVNSTGSWGDGGFHPVTARNIPLRAGENLFEFRVLYGGFNVDRFEFRRSAPYAGTPFEGVPRRVPGRVQAEHYDHGCLGVAFFDTTGPNNGFYHYRTDCPITENIVDLERNGDIINIAWTSGGEWTKYTLDVTQAGVYDITVRMASGGGASGSISLTFNDVDEYPDISIRTANWQTFSNATLRGVRLEQGRNVMRMTIGSNVNVDWFEFVRTGPL